MCRTDLALEILASRQQVALLKRKSPPETESDGSDILDSVRRVWSRRAEVLPIVKPETVVGWHRAGFRLYWHWRSRGPAPGRATITAEIQELIRRMARENPSWGAPKIHGELLKLGFVLSERSVSRRPASRRAWKALASLPAKSPRGHRCDGFLYHADGGLPSPVLLLRHRACATPDSAFHVAAHPNSDWVVHCVKLSQTRLHTDT